MKQYVSPCVLTIELSMEDILTESTGLAVLYQPNGDVIDNVSWNGLNG